MNDILILIAGFIVAIILAVWAASKQLEKSVYETFKKIGIKALGIIALINIFNSSSDRMSDDSSDPKAED